VEPPSIAAYRAAVLDPTDDAKRDLTAALTDDVTVVGLLGAAQGRDAVVEALASAPLRGLLTSAEWSAPKEEGGRVTVEARLAPGLPLAGLELVFDLAEDGRIRAIRQAMIAAAPPEATPLVLTDDMRTDIDGALANGTPVMVAYVDAEGFPHISPRGSVQWHGEHELAMWIRDPAGGLLRGIATNPRLALFYRDGKRRVSYDFTGIARVDDEPAVRALVFERTAEIERNLDALERGVAVVIDLVKAEGASTAGRFKMARDPS
jgi:hypothetical protein